MEPLSLLEALLHSAGTVLQLCIAPYHAKEMVKVLESRMRSAREIVSVAVQLASDKSRTRLHVFRPALESMLSTVQEIEKLLSRIQKVGCL